MNAPMLADFAIRLAGGLAMLLLVAPWRRVPSGFFRTHCVVILALLVLAGLVAGGSGLDRAGLGGIVAAAVLAYLGSVAWGIGLPRLAVPITALLALDAAALLIALSRQAPAWLWGLNASGRLVSALLLGSALSAMLLGHYYLTAPVMSIAPLRRLVLMVGSALALRAVLAAVGLLLW